MPGHIFPMLARDGGVLVRAGLTEAAVDLVRLAGMKPAAAVCTILDDAGMIAGVADLDAFAELFELRRVDIPEIVAYRLRTESLVHRVADAPITCRSAARFRMVVYRNDVDHHEHIALVKGRIAGPAAPLVRMHSECLTGDVLGSERCDCGEQLCEAIHRHRSAGARRRAGVHAPGRARHRPGEQDPRVRVAGPGAGYGRGEPGTGLRGRRARLRHRRRRSCATSASSEARLLTNNPKKIEGLARYGITVVAREALEIAPHPGTLQYLRTKREKLGHMFTVVGR